MQWQGLSWLAMFCHTLLHALQTAFLIKSADGFRPFGNPFAILRGLLLVFLVAFGLPATVLSRRGSHHSLPMSAVDSIRLPAWLACQPVALCLAPIVLPRTPFDGQ